MKILNTRLFKLIIYLTALILSLGTLKAQYDELDLCRTAVYLLDNGNLSKSVSKTLVKSLENVIEDEVKRLKVKERFYNTGCNNEDCAGKELDKTKVNFAFILNSDLSVTPGRGEIVLTNILYDFILFQKTPK